MMRLVGYVTAFLFGGMVGANCPAHAATSANAPAVVTFTATIVAQERLAITTHDLGNGVWSIVGTHNDERPVEMLAMAGDFVEFDATGSAMVAVRRYQWAGEAVALR
jgi:hypothetical protein